MDLLKEYQDKIKRYNRIIIWGFRFRDHTHRYIHKHFYHTIKKLGGIDCIWVDNSPIFKNLIKPNDLVISVDIASHYLPIKPKVYYCLHNVADSFHDQLEPSFSLRLQVYKNIAETASDQWNETTFFDKKTRTLYQPWGTNLLENEFWKPIKKPVGKKVYWVGSIWNDQWNQGNLVEMGILKKVLEERDLKFVHLHGIPEPIHVQLIRKSRIAPAISGRWQVENNYLPCRMFKNISYGQLGISNVKKFNSIFKNCSIPGETIEELVDNAISLNPVQYKELIYAQQEITKNYTYLSRLNNILKAFEWIKNY